MATVRGGVPRNRTVGTTEIKPNVEAEVAVKVTFEVMTEDIKEDPAALTEAEASGGTKLFKRV